MPSSKLDAFIWKVRRVAADLRQQDVARETGLSITRYSEIERGLRTATALERRLIEATLPSLAASFAEIRECENSTNPLPDGLLDHAT